MTKLRTMIGLLALALIGAAVGHTNAWAQGRGGGGGARGGGGGFAGGGARGGAAARGTTGQSGPTSVGGATFQDDPQTNSIIVITDPETKTKIDTIVQDIDHPVPQALIKCLFLEVTHTNDTDFGVDWAIPIHSVNQKVVNADGTVDITQTNQGTVSTGFGVTGATDFTVVKLAYQDLNATLRALAKTSKLNVLSRPSVLARNNQEATITVGQEVPRITNSRIDATSGATLNTVSYDNIGIILQVTPFITPDGMVQMDVDGQISTFTGDSVAISNTATAPVYALREANTSVVVPSGMTVVIGGLMEDQVTEQIQKVPVLGDIPIIGAAFRRTTKNKTKTELLIFLTPTVVDTNLALQDMTTSETLRNSSIPEDVPHQTLKRYEVTK